MSKTELKTILKTKIIEKIIGNPSNTVSIIKKEEPPIDDNVITDKTNSIQPSQSNMKTKYEYIEKEPLENENYVYIDNDDLSRDIELHRDLNLEYNLSICIYKINHELRTPFLEFFFIKKDGFYQFPETTIKFNNIPENSDIETYFLDECSRLYNSTPLKNPIENISEMYKGFVDVGNNNIIAVFENMDFIQSTDNEKTDVFEKQPNTSIENTPKDVLEKQPNTNIENQQEDSIWAILDEILIKKRILDIPIEQYIIDMFTEYQVLNEIKDSTNFPIEKPIILYQCIGTYKNYENNYYYENEHRSKSISIMDERIDHDVFGNVYLFSIEPFEYDNLSKIKRYAAFINNTLYMLNKTNITKEELVGDEPNISKLPFKTYHCISFKEDDKDYWSINTNHLFVEL
jgi:hypothetical protein